MFWCACFRLDLPEDAGDEEVRALAAAFEPLLKACERSPVAHLNVAVSASAITAFERHGARAPFETISRLWERDQIELVATAAHGALLPLLPSDELERQLELNDVANARIFGDAYRPEVLWSPALAFSHKLAAAATYRGLEAALVDESATRCWPGDVPGHELPVMAEIPGFHLLPASRDLARELEAWRGDEPFTETRTPTVREFVISAMDVLPGTRPSRALLERLARTRSLRLKDLYSAITGTRRISPMPSSARASPDELGRGLPFAAWFRPGNPTQARQWALANRVGEALRVLHEGGFDADPRVRSLRATLDRGWRESWWRATNEGERDPGHLELVARQFAAAIDRAAPLLGDERVRELHAILGDGDAEAARPSA